ncbi:MAG: multiheme c-type cytochrome [bacterium]
MKNLLIVVLALGTFAAFMVPTPTMSGEEKKIEFVGATKCKMCHNKPSTGKIFDEWQDSHHAKAMDVLSDAEKKDPKCQKCHTTGFGEPGGFVSLEKTPAMAGVQCESCHGPGAEHIKSKPNKVIPHVWEANEEACVKCHNPESPTWDPNRYELNGKKAGFIYELAVQEVNHSEVLKAVKK